MHNTKKKKCRFPGRNLCAPGGKVAALLVDLDGTVVVCDPYFARARERFGYLMKTEGFSGEDSIALARETYMGYMLSNGAEKDQLALALVHTYKRLCRRAKKKVNPLVLGICEDIGNSPFFRDPIVFPNAAQVLTRARHNFLIIAVTMGNREAQKYKVRQAGMGSIFDYIVITPHDNKPERVRELIKDLDLSPEYSAFIGNSTRSDGACLSEMNFIHIPFEKGVFDNVDLPVASKYETFSVKDWRNAEERGILRLLMRREQAMQDQSECDCERDR